MDDTPDHVKKIQLDIWLAKTPGERLYLTLKNNDDLAQIWSELRKNKPGSQQPPPVRFDEDETKTP